MAVNDCVDAGDGTKVLWQTAKSFQLLSFVNFLVCVCTHGRGQLDPKLCT